MADADDLIARARAGDAGAFGELVDPLLGRLLLFIQRRAQGLPAADADADDLLQTTLARAWQALGSFQTGGAAAFHAWLRAIADGVVGDRRKYLGAKGRGAVGHRESKLGEGGRPLEPYDPRTSASKVAARREAFARAAALMDTLDEVTRRVVEAHLLEGLTLSEVGRELGLTKASVWERLHRAMDTLRVALGEP